MKFKPVLKNHHDLKKNGYKVVRKLHKLEKKKNVRSSGKMDGICFYVLSCRHLAELIEVEYADHTFAAKFTHKCDSFIKYLEKHQDERIDKSRLAAFLHEYTKFFNRVVEERIPFIFDSQMTELWNNKCLMAYISAWGGP